ncbi:hypothetical protein HJC23_006368 [Cyclotella cryptica]|uniref:Uncharacterized protein n=1 Tax=Cyclotella cryptica TaxID=29204 RepID=A0ABD3Q4S5_9STRA
MILTGITISRNYKYPTRCPKHRADTSQATFALPQLAPSTYKLHAKPSAKPIRKFTGKSSPASVFDSKSNSDRAPSANVQREREREFNLASIFERTFPIQAAALLAFTIFVSLVGFSGDITDGSDRNFYGDDDLIEETVVEQLERIRTDDAREVTGKIWI